jgi:hypothetical protein
MCRSQQYNISKYYVYMCVVRSRFSCDCWYIIWEILTCTLCNRMHPTGIKYKLAIKYISNTFWPIKFNFRMAELISTQLEYVYITAPEPVSKWYFMNSSPHSVSLCSSYHCYAYFSRYIIVPMRVCVPLITAMHSSVDTLLCQWLHAQKLKEYLMHHFLRSCYQGKYAK